MRSISGSIISASRQRRSSTKVLGTIWWLRQGYATLPERPTGTNKIRLSRLYKLYFGCFVVNFTKNYTYQTNRAFTKRIEYNKYPERSGLQFESPSGTYCATPFAAQSRGQHCSGFWAYHSNAVTSRKIFPSSSLSEERSAHRKQPKAIVKCWFLGTCISLQETIVDNGLHLHQDRLANIQPWEPPANVKIAVNNVF